MSRRGAMWPTELTGHPSFTQLTGLTQRLFQYLWLHPDLNAGGFIAYQPAVWANQAPDLTVDSINASVTEMTRCKVAAADPDTGELLVRGFIKLDSSRKPNMYVSAMRAIQTARSPRLRQVGWEDIQRMHPPPMTLKKDTPEETRLKLRCERDEAYEELRARIERFPNGSRTVPELPSEGVAVDEGEGASPPSDETSFTGIEQRSALCGHCGRYPPMQDGLCGACLGRGVKP